MVWCAHCQENCCTVDDNVKGFLICCCTGCGRVLDQDVFTDDRPFVKDGSGLETGVSKISSDSEEFEFLAWEVHRSIGLSNSFSVGHQAVDASECTELQDLENSADEDPENLSDIDDVEVDGYLLNEEKCLKTIIWEEMNKEYLEEQAEKEAACEVNSNGEAVVKPKKKRKQMSSEEENSETPLEETSQMLKKKTFSSRVNYEVLESLYAMEQEKAKNRDANGYEVVTFEYDPFGNEDKATLRRY